MSCSFVLFGDVGGEAKLESELASLAAAVFVFFASQLSLSLFFRFSAAFGADVVVVVVVVSASAAWTSAATMQVILAAPRERTEASGLAGVEAEARKGELPARMEEDDGEPRWREGESLLLSSDARC